MHPLYQRLRELDWDTFQRFAFQLLSEKHLGLKIRHVEGAGGDRGLDLFEGQLKGQPSIWQCKHFPNGLGPKQRPQVKESLSAALKHFKPRQWILVVSIDLDRKAHEWFQKLQRSYEKKTIIGLFQASDIVRELIYRRNIRDVFFPGAVFDTISVRRTIEELGKVSSEDLGQIAKEQLDELIARLEQADARFNYQITYGPNVGADIAAAPPAHPLLVASVLDQDKRVDVFARDIDALILDPPKVNFTIKGSGVAKFQEFLRTGKRQEFGTEEVSTPSSTLDFLFPQKQASAWKLVLMPPSSGKRKTLSLRVTFSSGTEQVCYELVQFRISSAGTDQAEIESISPLPFVLSFALPLIGGGEGTFTVKDRFTGADVRAVSKAIRAVSLLRAGGTVELYALEVEKSLGTLSVTASMTEEREKWEDVILDAARICEIYKVDLRVPERITANDLRALALLLAIAQGEPLPFDGFNAQLVKSPENENTLPSTIDQTLQIIAQFPQINPPPVVFGTAVNTGPISIHAARANIENPKDFLDRFENAKYGEGVPIRFNLEEGRAQLGADSIPHLYVKPAEG